jgi:hypothetical protein
MRKKIFFTNPMLPGKPPVMPAFRPFSSGKNQA